MINCLKASADKVKQLNCDFRRRDEKMGIAAKNDRFKVGFFCLSLGEFWHKTYTEASAGLIIQVQETFSDFESGLA